MDNFESLRLKWKETMYPSLSCVCPFDPFLYFFQSTITPILLNPYISIQLNPTLIHIILFYLPLIHVNSFLSFLQSLITSIFLLPTGLYQLTNRINKNDGNGYLITWLSNQKKNDLLESKSYSCALNMRICNTNL